MVFGICPSDFEKEVAFSGKKCRYIYSGFFQEWPEEAVGPHFLTQYDAESETPTEQSENWAGLVVR